MPPMRVMHDRVAHGERRNTHPRKEEHRNELEPYVSFHEVAFVHSTVLSCECGYSKPCCQAAQPIPLLRRYLRTQAAT